MKSNIKIIFFGLVALFIIYYAIGYFSSYVGWYGYKKWEYRKASQSISESIRRGVFLKKLNYKFENYYGPDFQFEVFIEKGYKWGNGSSEETVIFPSRFPYQLSFPYRPIKEVGVRIRNDQLQKFDSCNSVWGYLQHPELPDTIILEILGENIKSGLLKVW